MRLEVWTVKTYDGWIDRVRGPVVRVSSRRGAYWLPRRKDLLTWEDTARYAPDLQSRTLWLLAVDLLADATAQDELAVRAAPDLVRELHQDQEPEHWLLFEEWLQTWVMGWICRELGLLPARGEVPRG